MATLAHPFAAVGLMISLVAGTATADTYRHIDDLAIQIERDSKRLVSETRHYRGTPEYAHLVEDARDMARLADHLHDLAHDHADLGHMEADVNNLDAKFHHLQSLFAHIEASEFHHHWHSHARTSHVERLLHSIEINIHHLQADLRSLRPWTHAVNRVPVPVISTPRPAPTYRDHDHDHGHSSGRRSVWNSGASRGITFGGGSSRFTIRF